MSDIDSVLTHKDTPQFGEPIWELARLFPLQGNWSEGDYLALDLGQQVEYSEGFIEVLPMPTMAYQRIVAFLFSLMSAYLKATGIGGDVLFAPLPVKVGHRQYREPDIVYLSDQRLQATSGQYPEGGDLLIEVVSESPADRAGDLIEKRHDYALAGVPEYWIVDPAEAIIIVLRLDRDTYSEHGRFLTGETATSYLLSGFEVPVADVWAAAQH